MERRRRERVGGRLEVNAACLPLTNQIIKLKMNWRARSKGAHKACGRVRSVGGNRSEASLTTDFTIRLRSSIPE